MTSTAPKYHRHYSLMFQIVAEFAETEAGMREANEYMEKNPGIGVLAVLDGRVILANNDDPGAATDVDQVIVRMKLAAKADRWGRYGESFGMTLIVVDVSRSGSCAWKISGRRVGVTDVRTFLEASAANGNLQATTQN